MVGMAAPRLEGDALAAVRHRGSHLQIIAAAGSGKTEVVAQRVADLLHDGVAPNGIVAFTFTERAAAELRHRIAERAEERVGRAVLDQLGGLFVGTIHAYCFQLLQSLVPRYETFDVLDDHRLAAFLAREARRLDLRRLDAKGRLFGSITRFLQGVDVVENELLDPAAMPDPFREVLLAYYDTLERYRLLTYGQQVVRAVREVEREVVRATVHADLHHLIVDEYQDVNPAQERLIELLAGTKVELCVVGDDDQAIYQWRGSDVSNIVTFASRYPAVATFEITTNRRSRPAIIDAANRFATTIPGRLPKEMAQSRPPSGGTEVVAWTAPDERREAGWVTNLALDLHDAGVPYRGIAVLVRGRAAYRQLVDELATFDVPVQPGGRTGLFDQPEARVLGRTFAWMTDVEWRGAHGRGELVAEDALIDEYRTVFVLDAAAGIRVRRYLRGWRDAVPSKTRTADLVGELYDLLAELGVRSWEGRAQVGWHQAPEVVVVLVVGREEHAQPVANRDAGRDDEEPVGETGVAGAEDLVRHLPGDQHRHHDGLAAAGGHLDADARQPAVVKGVLRRDAGAEVGLAVTTRHLGHVDRRLGRLPLAEQHRVLPGGIGPVEEELAGDRSHPAVAPSPPQLDPGPDVVDQGVDLPPFPGGVEVEALLLVGIPLALLALPADGHRDVGLARTPPGLDLAGGAMGPNDEVPARWFVGRIQDRVLEARRPGHRSDLTRGLSP